MAIFLSGRVFSIDSNSGLHDMGIGQEANPPRVLLPSPSNFAALGPATQTAVLSTRSPKVQVLRLDAENADETVVFDRGIIPATPTALAASDHHWAVAMNNLIHVQQIRTTPGSVLSAEFPMASTGV